MNLGNNFNTNTISSRAPLTTSFFAFIFDFGFKACRGFPVLGADDKDGFDAKAKPEAEKDGRKRLLRRITRNIEKTAFSGNKKTGGR
ncbi:hypothetical protein H8693_08720 [Christensenellaceae bacterium NSJ-63]|uniref:Uncharacterized protein n=1 Tax=Guopingia tenuis TaxID=2763656 RepID=A0A926HXR0_9FIRM|nr:hypothetical protein [Guopingia tenuis]MBC8539016.1 hypothetical protein [Guopingia tenuis]